MNNGHKTLYIVKEMREKLDEIVNMLDNTDNKIAEAQRILVEMCNHLDPIDIPIVRGKVDINRLKFKLNKNKVEHVI